MRAYRDDYPDLTGVEWEEAMDAAGHNVTSHLHENGACAACGVTVDPDGGKHIACWYCGEEATITRLSMGCLKVP